MSEKQAGYRIHNKFLPVGFIYKIIVDTLNAYEAGEDISDSPLIKWGRRTLEQGAWWHGVEKASPEKREKALQQRQRWVINLYLDIKNNGYNDSPISIFFDDDGNIKTYDGFHRLSILKYLGMEVMLNCQISTRKTDFPLVETLMELHSGRNLYQPCDDPRLTGFGVWRRDSSQRLAYILKHIKGKTVLDIGCSEGYFSRELAKKGFSVTAIDIGKKRVAITRYLATLNSLKLNYHVGKWQEYLKGDVEFDNILFLSVFHHDMLRMNPSKAFDALKVFRGKAKRIFFETPIKASDIKWLDQERKKLWDISEDKFKAKIEEATQMTIKDTWYGIRPLFLLES